MAALSAELGRPLPLIAESDLNDPVMLEPRSQGGYGLDAQWDDDVHHALHALLTGERQGYYVDFGPLSVFAKVADRGLLPRRHVLDVPGAGPRPTGRPRPAYRGARFVVCLQNHDQVGNRAAGDRLSELTPPDLLRVGAVLLFTLPFTPMLWMGEEWAASTRWPFFTSHPEPELAQAVSEGRVEEFAGFGWDPDDVVDPQDPSAFRAAKLNWRELEQPDHARMLHLYTQLARPPRSRTRASRRRPQRCLRGLRRARAMARVASRQSPCRRQPRRHPSTRQIDKPIGSFCRRPRS